MNSESKSNDDDGDTATNRVLDYYKKYAQNKELPKYFSGTSVSYLPKIKDEDPNTSIIVPEINIHCDEAEKDVDTSRASSALSNRKLEWDNGADIGYENLQDIKVLRKSISLPVITDAVQSDPDFDMKQIAQHIDRAKSEGSTDSNVKIILLSFSSSSDGQNPGVENIYSSTSSEPEAQKLLSSFSSNTNSNPLSKNTDSSGPNSDESGKEKISQFASSLSYLKRKIGLPGAHSTPKYLEARKSDPELHASTPVAEKPMKSKRFEEKVSKSSESSQASLKNDIKEKPRISKIVEGIPATISKEEGCKEKKSTNSDAGDHIITYKNSKVVNLAVTKPITVECTCSPKPKQPPVVVTKQTSVGIQTDAISERELIQVIKKSEENNKNQSLIFFNSESDKTNSSTQTGSEMASRCDSFEFYKNSGHKSKTPSSESGSAKETSVSKPPENPVSTVTVQNGESNLKRSQKTADLTRENSNQSSLNDICLGNVISASQLDNDGGVEKSFHLLYKLLKSKKYDVVTKKRYIKKVMEKITNSKYLEESSTSSDLFRPKKSKVLDLKPPKPLSTDTSDEKPQKNTLQLNLPLYLALAEKPKTSPRKRRLGVKTFIQDFLPSRSQSSRDEDNTPEIIPCDLKDTKKNCFTLTNNEFSVNREQLNKGQPKLGVMQTYKSSYDTETSLEKQYESTSTPKSLNYQNWREDKTASEKMLEEKSGTSYGEGDCLVKFAEKERAYQINWINNEISHLGKLKGLLEKPTEPLPNVKKTTTVYTVSEDHACSATKGVKFQRNYVIETHLGTDTTQPINFNFKGKQYTVSDLTAKTPQCDRKTRKPVIGDIEVANSDSTTSIKVSTFCGTCRRSPCICVCAKCKKSSCICNVVKPAVCRNCHTIPCICRKASSSRHHPHCLLEENVCWRCNKNPCVCPSPSTASSLSGKTICLVCHRTPCVCSRAGSVRGVLSKTCLSCGKYPCIYGKSKTSTISDEYAGTFVVACPSKSALGGGYKRKCATFPLTSKDESERRCSACRKYPCICETSSKASTNCMVCGKHPCICDTPKNILMKPLEICETPKTCPTFEKACSVCGNVPCICEKIKREYFNRGTSISSKSLEKCTVCGKHPCICKILKLVTSSPEKCMVCKMYPCVCDTARRDYITKATSVSHKSLENCSLCGKFPCICDLLRKNVDTKGTSISVKSLGICSACGKSPCICEELSKTSSSLKDSSDSCTGSLKKVFENCNCSTQTSCTCDFVEKLIQRFNKADAPTSTVAKECRSSSLQTDDTNKCGCQHVAIQTQVDIRHQNLQAGICSMGDVENKISQTERCCQNIGIQTQTDTCHLKLQTSKVGCNEEEATQVEIVSCNEEDRVKSVTFTDKPTSPRSCGGKINVGVTCEVNHGTQTLGDRRVMLTCSSQSDGSRVASPVERTQSAGISRKRHKQTSCVANKRCTCCADEVKTPIITEEYDSKTESLESGTMYIVSPKSSSAMTSSCNGNTESASDPSSSSSLVACICCKVKYPPEKISMLGSANQNFPLCKYCLRRRPILTSLCYAGPEHVCTCYKPVRNDVIHDIKKTVSELYNLEFCSCSTPTRSKNSDYCTHCQMKLKNTAKTRNGIAYTLTLEDKSPCMVKSKRKRKTPCLEEIRIKVPNSCTRKEHKDKVNLCRQDGDKEGVAVGYVERISTDCDNRRGQKTKVICSKTKRNRKTNLTLQDYLKKNKPDFIDTAEYRRRALYNSRSERELKKDEAKLRFFDDNKCKCKLKKENTKVFTEQEMKAITKRNYAKLPEVQQKYNERREERLRNADKFIVDVFSTKIRNCALKGKKDFPLSQNIVSLPRA